jgi:hypothetical protein
VKVLPSADTSRAGQARHQAHPGVEIEQVTRDVLEDLLLRQPGLHHGVQRGRIADQPPAQDRRIDRGPGAALVDVSEDGRRNGGRPGCVGWSGRGGRPFPAASQQAQQEPRTEPLHVVFDYEAEGRTTDEEARGSDAARGVGDADQKEASARLRVEADPVLLRRRVRSPSFGSTRSIPSRRSSTPPPVSARARRRLELESSRGRGQLPDDGGVLSIRIGEDSREADFGPRVRLAVRGRETKDVVPVGKRSRVERVEDLLQSLAESEEPVGSRQPDVELVGRGLRPDPMPSRSASGSLWEQAPGLPSVFGSSRLVKIPSRRAPSSRRRSVRSTTSAHRPVGRKRDETVDRRSRVPVR